MGLGPPVIALYYQLKTLGVFDSVREVVELGSQDVWCPYKNMMRDLFRVFGREVPPAHLIDAFAEAKGSARDLYENLGMKYVCVDVDARHGALALDMNFDEAPPEHKNRYDLTTNHGTSEHLLNQYNVFKMMHELTKPGGFMLHAVPFTVHLEHGFFNYQPKFFEALARSNSYKTFGVWIGLDWQLPSFVPWQPLLLDHLVLSPKTTHLLVVLQQKVLPQEFHVPIPGLYDDRAQDNLSARCCMVVDSEYYDGARSCYVTQDMRPLPGVIVPSARHIAVSSSAAVLGSTQSVMSPVAARAVEASVKRGYDSVEHHENLTLGLGPSAIALYRQLKALGMIEGVREVAELGSKKVWCPQKDLMRDLFRVFGCERLPDDLIDACANQKGSARDLYEKLGMKYTCVDRSGEDGALKLNLDFDSVPPEHRNRYDLATNHGTSEHLINQHNVFKVMHELTKPGGLMLHTVPFTVQLEHGFFNYQPNLFDALAQHNSYQTLGVWIGVGSQSPSFIPWHHSVLDYLEFSPRAGHQLVVLFQKMYECEFCVPFQRCYEAPIPERTLARYRMVIDGQCHDGASARRIRQRQGVKPVSTPTYSFVQLRYVLARDLALELTRRVQRRIHQLLRGRFKQAVASPRIGPQDQGGIE